MDFMIKLVEILRNSNLLIGILVSLLGGFLASFSPCSLSTIPMILGYVSQRKDSKNNLKYSIFFAFGMIITFVALGVVFSLLGKRIMLYGKWFNLILGAILIGVTLNLFGVIGNKNEKACKIPNLKRNVLGAFFTGILGGFVSSPCTAPILIAILTFASVQGNLITGILYMLAYAIGSSLIIILAGTSIGFVEKLSANEKYAKAGKIFKIIFGILTLVLALYLLYEGF